MRCARCARHQQLTQHTSAVDPATRRFATCALTTTVLLLLTQAWLPRCRPCCWDIRSKLSGTLLLSLTAVKRYFSAMASHRPGLGQPCLDSRCACWTWGELVACVCVRPTVSHSSAQHTTAGGPSANRRCCHTPTCSPPCCAVLRCAIPPPLPLPQLLLLLLLQ